MQLQEHVSLKRRTTMRIGGTARYFAELSTKDEVEEAARFAEKEGIPLFVLGGGSNTIFADGEIQALVVKVQAADVDIHEEEGTCTVQAGKNLPQLINELAAKGLDLSPLTGILGTVGGAVFGNAGQGPGGIWMDSFVESVEVFEGNAWKTYTKDECHFRYRESIFKEQLSTLNSQLSTLIWSATLTLPKSEPERINSEIERLLQKRIETQPHIQTAGSCFKAVGDTPAWQLIDAAGMRDTRSGGVHISEKHANFLINDGEGTFEDALHVVRTVREAIPEELEVEMRFVGEDGEVR